jgi:hypothetical protein
MLTQLSTVKARLGIDPSDIKDDELVTRMIEAMSARFDKECNRQFAREVNAEQEFWDGQAEILLLRYPVETVTRFEVKTDETEGWVVQPMPRFLLRSHCVISLERPLAEGSGLGKVVYTGGYVLPGDTVGANQTRLPEDVEAAAVEMVAFWYQNRDRVGVLKEWPKGGIYQEFADIDLIPSVRAVLEGYVRWRV